MYAAILNQPIGEYDEPPILISAAEASDPNSPERRAAAAAGATREVLGTRSALERTTTVRLVARLERLKRELQGVIATAGSEYRGFTASSLIEKIDVLIAAAQRDLERDAARAYVDAAGLGDASVDEPIKAARIGLSATPSLDRPLVVAANELTADLLSEPMLAFRNKVVAGVRRAALAGASSHTELQKLAASIDRAGYENAAFFAERIIRTELGRVLNGATFARMEALAEKFPFLRKGWRAARDARVRLGHVEAAKDYARGNGIPIAELFQVRVYQEFNSKKNPKPPKLIGTALLRYPIDPSASPSGRIAAGATIMCRCNAFTDFAIADLRAWSTSRTSVIVPELPPAPAAPAPAAPAVPGFAEPPIATRRPPKPPAPTTPVAPIATPALPAGAVRVERLHPALEGEGRKLGVNAARLEKMVRDTQAALRFRTGDAFSLARAQEQRPVTLEEIKAYVEKMDAHVRKLVEGGDIYIRAPRDVLGKILNDGRFKSQFESGMSEGMFDPIYRERVEFDLWGLAKDTDKKNRIIYGYLSSNEDGTSTAMGYGNVVIKLKPAVRLRSTFTMNDSFALFDEVHGSRGYSSSPSLVSAPRYWAYPTTEQTDVLDVLNVNRPGRGAYSEVQIFGGVSVSDIESVTFEHPALGQIPDYLRALLEKLRIPYRIFKG